MLTIALAWGHKAGYFIAPLLLRHNACIQRTQRTYADTHTKRTRAAIEGNNNKLDVFEYPMNGQIASWARLSLSIGWCERNTRHIKWLPKTNDNR